MTVSIDLTGRTALVTGGTRGIGLAIVERLAAAGAGVVATGTGASPSEGLMALEERGLSVDYAALDLASDRSLDVFLNREFSKHSFDVLVNNAGVNKVLRAEEVTRTEYDRLHAVNLRGPLLLSKAIIPQMREREWGRIVNIASIWASITKPGRGMYTASKFGLVGLTKTLAVENAEYGVLVNAVSPGFTITELTRSTLTTSEIEGLAAQVPARRFAEPSEMADVVTFLCSPLNTYLTAQNVTVDGGFTSV